MVAVKPKLVVEASTTNLAKVRDFITEASSELGVDTSIAEDLQLAVDEAVTNIILHGYGETPGDIEVQMYKQDEGVVVAIRDDAPAFDFRAVVEPDLSISPLDQVAPGGYGISLITRLVDDIKQNVTAGGRNELLLVKRCGAG